jgi:hypothetical protein
MKSKTTAYRNPARFKRFCHSREKRMRKRFIMALAGSVAGYFATSLLNAGWELPTTMAAVICSGAGLALGYVGSMLFDVFAGNVEGTDLSSGR